VVRIHDRPSRGFPCRTTETRRLAFDPTPSAPCPTGALNLSRCGLGRSLQLAFQRIETPDDPGVSTTDQGPVVTLDHCYRGSHHLGQLKDGHACSERVGGKGRAQVVNVGWPVNPEASTAGCHTLRRKLLRPICLPAKVGNRTRVSRRAGRPIERLQRPPMATAGGGRSMRTSCPGRWPDRRRRPMHSRRGSLP
jgi:hypothetical protein